jgi:hypothetical protein
MDGVFGAGHQYVSSRGLFPSSNSYGGPKILGERSKESPHETILVEIQDGSSKKFIHGVVQEFLAVRSRSKR